MRVAVQQQDGLAERERLLRQLLREHREVVVLGRVVLRAAERRIPHVGLDAEHDGLRALLLRDGEDVVEPGEIRRVAVRVLVDLRLRARRAAPNHGSQSLFEPGTFNVPNSTRDADQRTFST